MNMSMQVNMNVNRNTDRNMDTQEKVFQTARIDSRTLTRCHVCGFAEVRTDEVVDREILFLAECPRCENRWTSRVPIGRPLPLAAPVRLVARRFQRVPAA